MLQTGWRPLAGPMPWVVAEATRSSRNKMAMTTERDGQRPGQYSDICCPSQVGWAGEDAGRG
jgi:hypothetical protein